MEVWGDGEKNLLSENKKAKRSKAEKMLSVDFNFSKMKR